MKQFEENEYYYTPNGEITFNETTGMYTVWDETYAYTVCVTQYPFIAEAALELYCKYLNEGQE